MRSVSRKGFPGWDLGAFDPLGRVRFLSGGQDCAAEDVARGGEADDYGVEFPVRVLFDLGHLSWARGRRRYW